jgi:hypothetical protein
VNPDPSPELVNQRASNYSSNWLHPGLRGSSVRCRFRSGYYAIYGLLLSDFSLAKVSWQFTSVTGQGSQSTIDCLVSISGESLAKDWDWICN